MAEPITANDILTEYHVAITGAALMQAEMLLLLREIKDSLNRTEAKETKYYSPTSSIDKELKKESPKKKEYEQPPVNNKVSA